MSILSFDTDNMIDWVEPVNWLHLLNRGLVAWYLAVLGATGGKTWQDLCRRNHGTLTGMDPETDWVATSRSGGYVALDFGGTNDYVLIPSLSLLDGATQATLMGWFYRTSASTGLVSFGRDAAVGSTRFTITWFNDGILYLVCDTGAANANSRITDSQIGWHHFTMVYNGRLAAADRVRGYVDGQYVTFSSTIGTHPASLPSSAASLAIGRSNTNSYSVGQADDCRVSLRAFSDAEVAAYYRLSLQGYPGLLNRVPSWYYGPAAAGAVGNPWYYYAQQAAMARGVALPC